MYKNYSGCLRYRDLEVSPYKLSNLPGPVSRRLPYVSPMCKCSFSKLFIFPEPEIHSGAPDVTPPPLCPASSPSPYIPLRVSVCASERFCILARSAAHTASASSKRKTCEPLPSAGNTQRFCCCCAFYSSAQHRWTSQGRGRASGLYLWCL